jgi:hypothetical protein
MLLKDFLMLSFKMENLCIDIEEKINTLFMNNIVEELYLNINFDLRTKIIKLEPLTLEVSLGVYRNISPMSRGHFILSGFRLTLSKFI